MKRCPQCEFIYEDDQSLCDMDGALLVFDARTLPNLHALAPVEAPLVPRVHSRPRILPAMAALILATVLSLVYLVSTQRSAPAPSPAITPISNSLPPSEVNQTPAPPAAEVNEAATTSKEEPEPEPTKPTPAAPTTVARKATVKAPTTQRKPAEESKKDNSKVRSILKKTGRILKKPFKF